VVANLTAEGDGVDAADGACAQTEIDVLAAVHVRLVKSSELLPKGAFDQGAGSRDGRYAVRGAGSYIDPGWELAQMFGFAGLTDDDARVVDFSRANLPLYISHQAGPRAERPMHGEHGLEPARGEFQIAVEQGEETSLRRGSSAIVGRGVAEIAFV
jgi:hypothetical protein